MLCKDALRCDIWEISPIDCVTRSHNIEQWHIGRYLKWKCRRKPLNPNTRARAAAGPKTNVAALTRTGMDVDSLCDFRVWIAGCPEKGSLTGLNFIFSAYMLVEGLGMLSLVMHRFAVQKQAFRPMDGVLLCSALYMLFRNVSTWTMLTRALPFQAVLLFDVFANMFAGFNCGLFFRVLGQIYVNNTTTSSFVPKTTLDKMLMMYTMLVQVSFLVIAYWMCFPASIEQYIVLRRAYFIATALACLTSGWLAYKLGQHIVKTMEGSLAAMTGTERGADTSTARAQQTDRGKQSKATRSSNELRFIINMYLLCFNTFTTIKYIVMVLTIDRYSDSAAYNSIFTVVYNVQTTISLGYVAYMVIRKQAGTQ